jgi:DNA topoisomerase-1
VKYIITEKNSTARRITHILSDGRLKQDKILGIDVYKFDGTSVIGLSGHVLGVDFPSGYRNWNRDVRKLINAQIIKIPTNEKIVSLLEKIAKDADCVTIATDFDREGELIGVEALHVIKRINPAIKADRVRYSAITEKEIEKVFAQPKEIDYNLASAGETRQEIDLIWGATLTRFISTAARSLGNDFLSVGRVQSPTLALLVDRERKIDAFVPTPYWEILAAVNRSNIGRVPSGRSDSPAVNRSNIGRVPSGRSDSPAVNRSEEAVFTAKHKCRFREEDDAQAVISKLGKEGMVIAVEHKRKEVKPVIPFNTTGFIQAACSIGFSAQNAMRIAEQLYIDGYISYPRTDNTVYPTSLDLKSLMGMFLNTEFDEYARTLLKGKMKPTKGKKRTTDHPPIHPVAVACRKDLREDQWKIYELVCRRFFATFALPSVIETMKVDINISGETFRATGLKTIEEGWRFFYPYGKREEKSIPSLEKGENLSVLSKELVEKETKPPPRYRQGGLIKKMEELGLGTKSTRHEIIGKLYARSYVSEDLHPTKKAYSVMDSLEKHAEMITKPEMTASLEEKMNLIAEGKMLREEVVLDSREMLGDILDDLISHRDAIANSLREGIKRDRIIGVCPECGSDLLVRNSRKGKRFIGCSAFPKCEFSLPLPKSGRIFITKEKCNTHGLYHIKIINGRKSFMLGCPYCNFIRWRENEEKQKQNHGG